jgi:alpha 1,2-mannosyltransferase
LVPKDQWSIPTWVDEEKAAKARKDMEDRNIIYGGSLPYRHMCRFQSGFFFRQPQLDEYNWYWRVVISSRKTFVVNDRNLGQIIIVTLIMMYLNLWS